MPYQKNKFARLWEQSRSPLADCGPLAEYKNAIRATVSGKIRENKSLSSIKNNYVITYMRCV